MVITSVIKPGQFSGRLELQGLRGAAKPEHQFLEHDTDDFLQIQKFFNVQLLSFQPSSVNSTQSFSEAFLVSHGVQCFFLKLQSPCIVLICVPTLIYEWF